MGNKTHFSLFSHHAQEAILGLFDEKGELFSERPMTKVNGVWQVETDLLAENTTYAFRLSGPQGNGFCFDSSQWLADPYARSLLSPTEWGQAPDTGRSVRAYVNPRKRPFDWEGVTRPLLERQDLILYEMHVRGFTQDPSSQVSTPGTFQGLLEKIPHLKRLGITAVELMPIFEFDETHTLHPPLTNYWGYDPLHFFSPMRRYSNSSDPIDEFKSLVRELHRNGIQVLLDVVYNHTGEGKKCDYRVNFRGVDQHVYYMLNSSGHLLDYTGCGNVFNVNHPVVTRLILESLRYWVEEFHIDGFRFDLAAIFTRGTDGNPAPHSPLLETIQQDPLLKNTWLIAEPWDAAGLYLAGQFAEKWHFSEWNGQFRDHVRSFLKGSNNEAGRFASSLCGSDFLFAASHTPLSSINFITSHDGFTLRDLVTYEKKHNLANQENNKDGSDNNLSWNCGIEGPTDNPEIVELRERQMRNFFLALFISQGIPMLAMRDEYGHSCLGNNNPYLQDNKLNWFAWDHERDDIVDFVAALIAFRKTQAPLRHTRFLTKQEVEWHGTSPSHPDFGPHSHFVAFTLKPSLYIAFNASSQPATLHLPLGAWTSLIETAQPWHAQWTHAPLPSQLTLPSHSALLAEASKH